MKPSDDSHLKSIIPKARLSSSIWEKCDAENHLDICLKEDVRDSLLRIANEFYIYLGVSVPVLDITLTGSLANYNWTSVSDVDLHLLVDYSEVDDNLEFVKEFLMAKKSLWNEKHDIQVKGHEVELYTQDTNEPHHSTGVYSILEKEWIAKPEKMSSAIDTDAVLEKAYAMMKSIDHALNSPNRLTAIDAVKEKIKKMRQSGLEASGELSTENLAFKILRRNGYLEKLYQTGLEDFDQSLSLDQ